MSPMFLTTHRCLVAIAFPLLTLAPNPAAFAQGPVERTLERMGPNVPTPDRRPGNAATLPAEPAPGGALENPLDEDAAAPSSESTDEPKVTEPAPLPPIPEDPATALSIGEPSCVEELRAIARAEVSDQPIDADEACVIDNPVILMSTRGDYPVRFADNLLLSCPFALRLARFTNDTIQPLARHHIGAPLVELGSGQGFVCRRRVSASSNKWSEHSFGKAIDIIGFAFAERDALPVRTPDDMNAARAAFFQATRVAACGTFTTVLGPGSNAAHATHLHLDTARMTPDKKNPYRICE